MTAYLTPVTSFRTDERCQPRVSLSTDLIGEYADAMKAGEQFPPVVAFHDGEDIWLADGFHRIYAAKQAGVAAVLAEVRPGSLRDAMLYSVGANAQHGMRRTNADKRKSVETLLNDPEWSLWTDSEIARRCAVHHSTVAAVRSSLAKTASDTPNERTYTDRHGNVTTMNTANIGKSRTRTTEVEPTPRLSDDEPLSDLPYDVVDPYTGEILESVTPALFTPPEAPVKRPLPPTMTSMGAATALLVAMDITTTDLQDVAEFLVEMDKDLDTFKERTYALTVAIGEITRHVSRMHRERKAAA